MHHIFGYTSPDTDAFASAFAFAHFLNQQDIKAQAYRLGEPNLETKFVLGFLHDKFDEPMGLPDGLLPFLDPINPQNTLQKGDKIGLTDHNEQAQSIANLSDFDIRYIIDHHKIGLTTPTPAYIRIAPVGCTCTILCEMFDQKDIAISPMLATFMLSAIISDTLNLTSPTTTDDDRVAVGRLCQIANMSIQEKDELANAMFYAKSDISHLTAREILLMDYKAYEFGGHQWGIAGIETMDVGQILARQDELIKTVQALKHDNNLDHLMIAIVDIKDKQGYAIACDDEQAKILASAFNATAKDGVFILDGVVSRKKQIVPTLEQYYQK